MTPVPSSRHPGEILLFLPVTHSLFEAPVRETVVDVVVDHVVLRVVVAVAEEVAAAAVVVAFLLLHAALLLQVGVVPQQLVRTFARRERVC